MSEDLHYVIEIKVMEVKLVLDKHPGAPSAQNTEVLAHIVVKDKVLPHLLNKAKDHLHLLGE